jgi:hypothetical protein
MQTRHLFLFASGVLVASVMGMIVGFETLGNHAVGDSGFGKLVPIATGIIFALADLVLSSLLINVPGRWTWLKTAGLVLLLGITAQTWVWVRAGYEVSVHEADKRTVASAESGAWERTLSDLERDAADALKETPAQLEARANCDRLRQSIAAAVKTATDMDNNGLPEDDRLIPGQLALVDSLKADLANEEARTERLAKSDTRHADALLAIAAHRADRGKTAANEATTAASVHQFVRWSEQWAPVLGISQARALELILALMTTGWLVAQYAGMICLNLSARIPLTVEPEPEPAPVTPPKSRKPRPKPESVQMELVPASPAVQRRYESQKLWHNERTAKRKEARQSGLTSKEAERLRIDALRERAAA